MPLRLVNCLHNLGQLVTLGNSKGTASHERHGATNAAPMRVIAAAIRCGGEMPSERGSADTQEIVLTGKLAEFRTALQQEIEAGRRQASSNGVPLINGRLVGRIGVICQYVFEIENVLNLPGDAPGDLRVEGRDPVPVMVVAVEGLSITLAVSGDLGPLVPRAVLISNLTFLMRRLIERIEALAEKPNPAGDRILGERSIDGTPEQAEFPGMNAEQALAINSSLGRNATFIWGPPGTGKTRTIGAIGEQLYRRSRSVLLVSHTNGAVDQALLQIAKSLPPEELLAGKVFRVGEPQDQRLHDYPDLLLQTHVTRRSEALVVRKNQLFEERADVAASLHRLSRQIAVHEWARDAIHDITSMRAELDGITRLQSELASHENSAAELATQGYWWEQALQRAVEAQQWKTDLDSASNQVDALRKQRQERAEDVDRHSELLAKAEATLGQTQAVTWLIRQWRGWPSPEEQSKVVDTRRRELELSRSQLQSTERTLIQHDETTRRLTAQLEAFFQEYLATPPDVARRANEFFEKQRNIQSRIQALTHQLTPRKASFEEVLTRRLAALRELDLSEATATTLDDMLDAIQAAFQRAQSEILGSSLNELRAGYADLDSRLEAIVQELEELETRLAQVEETLIAEAIIVATTLTRSYLRDPIQKRRFDTVILDEASMAPIPALWVAASLADVNAVVVGDFRQLPPIVISDHPLAKKWLGQDVFDIAGMSDLTKPHLVALKWQYRMHPDIAKIPNTLIYRGLLQDAAPTKGLNADEHLNEWYRRDWGYDRPLLLVDTGPVEAWVTSVARGAGASRLNFLSATLCLDIADQILRPDRRKLEPGAPPRILIVCPYRPHAKLLELMIREQGFAGEVIAGTAHSFQGAEADVVIFDLVNDEPHWRVGAFNPAHDEVTRRLVNVAMTRARRRLVIIGDFEYIQNQGRKAFLGKDLIPALLRNGTRVLAHDVVPKGMFARAATAQALIQGGQVESKWDRIVVNQNEFFPLLFKDLGRSQRRVVIFSAFITENRLALVGPHLRAAIERGVHVYVVTKTITERHKNEQGVYRMLEKALSRWGVTVIHKQKMHEKLVFIDDNTIWSGSLNPLSFRDTQEIMERRASRQVVEDFANTMRLSELIGEYDGGTPACPCCGAEVVATEGSEEPYYWRCINDKCYTRSIDEPALKDGVVTCKRCGSAVEYKEQQGKPRWQCKQDRRHHRKLQKKHLLLPRMREIIPARSLKRLDAEFEITIRERTVSSADSALEPLLFDKSQVNAASGLDSVPIAQDGTAIEIWRMSRGEYHAYKKTQQPPEAIDYAAINREYKAAIIEARKAGKPVSQETLREMRLV